jgi:HlyD family secretion protein
VLALPIQALTIKTIEPPASGNVQAATKPAGTPEQQGVYVISKDKSGRLRVHFVPVTTGITGATQIEVLSGLTEGDEIVIGPFKTLRGLKENALIKRDTEKPQPVPSSNS